MMSNNHKWKIAQLALTSRLLLLLAMSLSCFILPDFHPGDDVLQFDLRLTPTIIPPSITTITQERYEGGNTGHCFCLQGHACDSNWESRRPIASYLCDDDESIHHQRNISTRYIWMDRVYAFILPPVTKWDGARFLTLAVNPWARIPQLLNNDTRTDENGRQTIEQVCELNDTSCQIFINEDRNKIFDPSEQSHAFLPLLPVVIRYTANFLIDIIPPNFLPLSYEGTVTLSAILINMVAFVIAAISLYDLTIYLLLDDRLMNIARSSDIDNDGSESLESDIMMASQENHLAHTTSQLFCINPAGVFFIATYSESLFAMLTFTGHAIYAKGQYCNDYLKIVGIDEKKHRMSLPKGTVRAYWWWANFYWLPSTLLWIMASFTRSNGSFSSIWILIVGTAKCISYIRVSTGEHTTKAAVKIISMLLFHGALASLVAIPVLFHDWRGYNFHCISMKPQQSIPEWCEHDGRQFSLYAHVQRKHWNVGLFRYYELKQIPNFLLALPLLTLSIAAVVMWILHSWNRHITSENDVRGSIRGFRLVAHNIRALLQWAYLALDASTNESSDRPSSRSTVLLLGPQFLSHYAILAGFALVGAFVAHVQISTRLICSSCPALYWFLSCLLVHGVVNDEKMASRVKSRDDVGRLLSCASLVALLLYSYFVLYNILGVVLHVNFLPWT